MSKSTKRKPQPQEPFVVKGKLNPVVLSSLGQGDVTQWLEQHLLGLDHRAPIDVRYGEDPDEIITTTVRALGVADPVVQSITSAVLDLLDRARKLAGESKQPSYVDSLLHICQTMSLPHVAEFFLEELAAAAQEPDSFLSKWGLATANEVLFAAIEQVPGYRNTQAAEYWRMMLRTGAYATFALEALSNSVDDQLTLLPEWWSHCAAEERTLELRTIVQSVMAEFGVDEGRKRLQGMGGSWPRELREATDRLWLSATGVHAFRDRPVVSRESLSCAIFQAGQQTKYLLKRP